MTHISNYSYTKLWDVITHPCPSVNDDPVEPLFRSGYKVSNCVPHKIKNIVLYPCPNLSLTMSIKGPYFKINAIVGMVYFVHVDNQNCVQILLNPIQLSTQLSTSSL